MSDPRIGKVQFEGQRKKIFKLVEGDNVFAVMPPIKSLVDKWNGWIQYYKVVWGYKNTKGNNKPFQCCRVVNRKTNMVEVESAAFLKKTQIEENFKATLAAFKEGRASREQLAEATELNKQFNIESKYFVNVMNLQGEIGLLKIGYRAKIALEEEIKSLRAQGIEAVGFNGVFFNFRRSGMDRNTTYQVTQYQENVEAEVGGKKTYVQMRKHYHLDTPTIDRLYVEGHDLGKLYPAVTAAQTARIVNEGPFAVDEILSRYVDTSTDNVEVEAAPIVEQPKPVYKAEPTIQQVVQQVANVEVVQPKPVIQAPIVQPMPVQAPVIKAEVKPVASNSMSDEDFLKSIGAL